MVTDLLHGHLLVGVEQHLGLNDDIVVDPLGGTDVRFGFDERGEVFAGQTLNSFDIAF